MKTLLHIVSLQVVWWTSVLSSIHFGYAPWLPFLWVIIFLLISQFTHWFDPVDRVLAVILCTIGIVLDTLWIHLGMIDYIADWPFAWLCPLWLFTLWFAVGFDFRHSLMWINDHKLIGAIVTGAAGPSSYWSGAALGIATIPESMTYIFPITLFISWFFLFPAFAKLALWLEARFNTLETKT